MSATPPDGQVNSEVIPHVSTSNSNTDITLKDVAVAFLDEKTVIGTVTMAASVDASSSSSSALSPPPPTTTTTSASSPSTMVLRAPKRREVRDRKVAKDRELSRLQDPSVQEQIQAVSNQPKKSSSVWDEFKRKAGIDKTLIDSLGLDKIEGVGDLQVQLYDWCKNSMLWGWALSNLLKGADKRRLNRFIRTMPYAKLKDDMVSLPSQLIQLSLFSFLLMLFLLSFVVNTTMVSSEQAFIDSSFLNICGLASFLLLMYDLDVCQWTFIKLWKRFGPLTESPNEPVVDTPQPYILNYYGKRASEHCGAFQLLITIKVWLQQLLLCLVIGLKYDSDAATALFVVLQVLWMLVQYSPTLRQRSELFIAYQSLLVLQFVLHGAAPVSWSQIVIDVCQYVVFDHTSIILSVVTIFIIEFLSFYWDGMAWSSPTSKGASSFMTVAQAKEDANFDNDTDTDSPDQYGRTGLARYEYATCFDHTSQTSVFIAVGLIVLQFYLQFTCFNEQAQHVIPSFLQLAIVTLPLHVLLKACQHGLFYGTFWDLCWIMTNAWVVQLCLPDFLQLSPFWGGFQAFVQHIIFVLAMFMSLMSIVGLPLYMVSSITYFQFRKAHWFIKLDSGHYIEIASTVDEDTGTIKHVLFKHQPLSNGAPEDSTFDIRKQQWLDYEWGVRLNDEQAAADSAAMGRPVILPPPLPDLASLANCGWSGEWSVEPVRAPVLGCWVLWAGGFWRCVKMVEEATRLPPDHKDQQSWERMSCLPPNIATSMDAALQESRKAIRWGNTWSQRFMYTVNYYSFALYWSALRSYQFFQAFLPQVTLLRAGSFGVICMILQPAWAGMKRQWKSRNQVTRSSVPNTVAPIVCTAADAVTQLEKKTSLPSASTDIPPAVQD